MTQLFIDAIANVRLVQGTIRLDTMKIIGTKEDNKYEFEKTGEIVMTGTSFNQVVKVLNEVDRELRDRVKKDIQKS